MPITQASYKHGVMTGISYGTQLLGLVPHWEEYEAMCSANYNEVTWAGVAYSARARAVAAYRLRSWISLHTDDARAAAIARAQAKPKR